ncbi:MAG: ABC transporter permease [Acidipila sp.]|nr:ABC transporter permease [Acidipila sp.]
MDTLWQDLRYAVRTLAKSPGFTAVVVLTLALGIGANTALFSVINGVLLNPLPYPEPSQLVTLHESKPNFETGSISYPNFRDWQKDNHTFSAIAVSRGTTLILTGMGEAEQLRGRFVSSDFFPLLGVKPVIGRTFAPGEDEIGAGPIAIVSVALWKRKFNSSPEILGKGITLDGKEFTIVGVIPANFDLLLRSFRVGEVYLPIGQWGNPLLTHRTAGLGIHGVGRLKLGVSVEQAQADMDRVTRNLAAAYPNEDKGIGAKLFPLREEMLGSIQPVLLVLLGAVGFVLLIACVNVANLLLARSAGRSREFAIRAALGAGQGRLIRQLLTESVLLALAGGGLGLLLAAWGTKAARGVLPAMMPRAGDIGLDSHVLIFTMAISLLAGILFGLAPALRTSQPDLHRTLKEGGRGSSGRRHHTQGVFVVVELSMALVLLIGAGLMIRSLQRLWDVDPGFNPRNVLTFGASLSPSMAKAKPDAIRAAFRELDDKLGAIPGVQAVSLSWGAMPMSGDDELLFWLDGKPRPASVHEMNWALKYVVDPDYLKVMRIPLLRGRFLTDRDNAQSPPVLVIDEAFAQKYFPNQDPIGKRLSHDDYNHAEIVGVVGHVNQWGLDRDATQELRAQAYVSIRQLPDEVISLTPGGVSVLLRSEGELTGLFDSVRRTVQQINSEEVVYGAQTMEEIISDSLAARRFSMILLGVFASLALLLSSVGIYGVISYLVGQRTHEIGIRVALGAQRGDVLRLVLGEGAKMALLGVGIGVVAALGLTRLMAHMLYGVSATDPLTFTAVATLLTGVSQAACYVPARRAMRVDPLEALRYE